MNLRVVKLGGSLLDLPELPLVLGKWLAAQPRLGSLLVVGGGTLAEEIRQAQARHRFADNVAHWLCVRAMLMQAEIMQSLLPEAGPLVTVHGMRTSPGELRILDPWNFMRHEDRTGSPHPLPESWDVTSDSIAARAAELLGADELVLLKSALPAQPIVDEMSRAGYVDRYFPVAARGIALLRCVKLRDRQFADVVIEGP